MRGFAFQDLAITPDLDPGNLWRTWAEPALRGRPESVRALCRFVFSETVANVLTHASATTLGLAIDGDGESLEMRVRDDGVGVFAKLRDALGLESEEKAARRLAWGRATTEPETRTGDGIALAARMFDVFRVESGGIGARFSARRGDWRFEPRLESARGTRIVTRIRAGSPRSAPQVLRSFTSGPGRFDFRERVFSVRRYEFLWGPLVTRYQARRLLNRAGRFQTAVLDFEGVGEIGVTFADEVFRVFAWNRPDVRIVPVRARDAVARMIHVASPPEPAQDVTTR